MQTRRDQVQAYRFAQARMQSALLAADPDRAEPPLRRASVATFAGLMIAVLVLAGFGIFGLLKRGGKQGWAEPGTLVVERETGTRFVYDSTDGALHPVLNYTSARLILDSADIRVEQFSHSSLDSVPRGAPRGIPGLPEGLPGTGDLVRGPWMVCSGAAGGAPSLTVSVGTSPSGSHVRGDRAVLARTPDDTYYLVWRDTRLRIPDPNTALPAFGYDRAKAVQVSATWVNGVRAGPDLAVRAIPGFGERADYGVGRKRAVRVGQLFEADPGAGVGTRYYIAARDGLAIIPTTVEQLLVADPTKDPTGGDSPQVVKVPTAAIGATDRSDLKLVPDGFPEEPGQIRQVTVGGGAGGSPALCASYRQNQDNSVTTTTHLTTVAAVPAGRTASRTVSGEQVQVVVPPGRAAVVRNLPHEGQPGGSRYLVTDQGAKFPVPPAQGSATHVLDILGYGSVDPVAVPDGILGLLPSGPALDQAGVNVDVPVALPPPVEG